MKLRLQYAALFVLPLTLALSTSACSDDGGSSEGGESESGSESGSETAGTDTDDSDSAEGGTDSNTTSPSTTDDSATDTDCAVGSEGCPCTGGGACDAGLMCEDELCVPATPGDGDGDPATTGDGDGDEPTGDGDGDGDGDTTGDGDGDDPTTGGAACEDNEVFIQIDAIDADYEGWEAIMSNLGEGEILAWDEMDQEAFVSFDIDIPCDDDWHVWVRAINFGQNDSFFVTVDGGPDPAPIFEIACDNGPNQATYQWQELNWRDPDAGGCDYVEDPWVQAWDTGAHNMTLSYRESYALTRVWITNTNEMPPA